MDNIDSFFAGLFLGVVITAITTLFTSSIIDTGNLINECQAKLPRDQHCVVIAIPEVSDE